MKQPAACRALLVVLALLALACSLRDADKSECRDQADCLDGFVCQAGVCRAAEEQKSCIGDCSPVPFGSCQDVFAFGEGSDNSSIIVEAPAEIRGSGGMQHSGELHFAGQAGGGHMRVDNVRSVHGLSGVVASAWVKLNAYHKGQRILGQYGKAAADDERGAYVLFMGPGSTTQLHDSLRFRVSTGPNRFTTVAGGTVPLGQWTHVLGRYTGSALELYVRGILVGSEPLRGPLYDSQDGQPLGLGATFTPAGIAEAPLDGQLDEVFVGTDPYDRTCMATCRDIFAYSEGTDTDPIRVFSPAAIRTEGGRQSTGHLSSTDEGYMRVDGTKDVDGLTGLVVSAWIKPKAYVNWTRVLGRYGWAAEGTNGSFLLALLQGEGAEHDRPQFQVATAVGYRGVSAGRLPLDTWTHVLGRYTGSSLELYINGVLENSVRLSGPLQGGDGTPLALFTGLYPDGTPDGASNFRGELDEVFIGSNPADYRNCLP